MCHALGTVVRMIYEQVIQNQKILTHNISSVRCDIPPTSNKQIGFFSDRLFFWHSIFKRKCGDKTSIGRQTPLNEIRNMIQQTDNV